MKSLLLLLLFTTGATLSAFSPYQNHLRTDRECHVGLIAVVPEDGEEKAAAAIAEVTSPALAEQLAAAGIRHAQAFTREIAGTRYAIVYFAYDGTEPYLGAAEAFESATREAADWSALVDPHPRALTYGRQWLQMEWINFIHGFDVDRTPTNTLMIGCRVRPEKEAEYRTLHQTVWPGVVDQAVRGKIRNLNIFLVELGDDLVEFLYLEYMGDDQAADDAANAADPINQRWWKLTDACQLPFADVEEGIWTQLERVD